MTRLQAKKSDRKINDFFTKSPHVAATSKRKRADSEESDTVDRTISRKTSRISLTQSTVRHVPIAWVQLPNYDEAFLAAHTTQPSAAGGKTDASTARKANRKQRVQATHASTNEDSDTPTPNEPNSPQNDGQRRNRRASRQSVRYTEHLLEGDEMEDEDANDEDEVKPRRRVSKGAPPRHDESDFEGQSSESEDDVQSSDDVSDAESTPPTSDTYSDDEPGPKVKSKAKVKQESRVKQESMPAGPRSQGDTSATRMKKLCGSGGGLDLSLPPLHKVGDIFSDITGKAVDFGLQSAVDDLKARKRPFRVATMCSGTESPLLALRMIQNCLAASGRDIDDTTIEHVFSAEIVPYKQAYIERNFAPSIIFRDITELTTAVEDPNPVATTVYGAKVPVPRDIDLVIAGTSCVDFSRLNKKQKDMDSGGESGDTWSAVLAFCRVFKPAVVLLENVYTAHWNKMLGHYEDIGYESVGVRLDSKDYYLPQTRQRGYMACFNQEKMGSKASPGAKWTDLMEKFRRPASAPASSFLQQSNEAKVMLDEPTTREVDWEKCAVRQMVYRQTMKLGNARPITHWQESNTMLPPENSSRAWFKRQVQRVLDTIDCAHIRNALTQNGAFDSHFKTRIWDLSQNVDRERDARKFGIVGCITPSGIFFVSDAGRALTPEELLSLQGIPLDEISFTTESPSEIQDLAGNAMSAPVVGCAIAAALIAASPARLLDCHEQTDETIAVAKQETKKAQMVTGEPESLSFKSSVAGFDLDRILRGAEHSSRMCYCEGAKGLASASIQKCSDCSHTICTACGGNPVHNYQPANLVRKSAREFEDELRAALPLRLKFMKKKVIDSLRGHHRDAYLEIIASALADDFCLSTVKRSYCWTATYSNAHSHLDFVINDGKAEWQLYVDAPLTLSGKDTLRKFLDLPVAKSRVLHSPLGDDWQWRLPTRISTKATIQAEGKHISSWWNRLGMPEYQSHHLPERLEIVCKSEPLAKGLNGTYQYLPNCGKASNSLYKRVDGDDDDDDDRRPLYLFLDPTRVGDPKDDTFVFSHNNAKLDYGEVRDVIAQVEVAWKPWPYNKASKSVEISVEHTWTSFDDCGPAAREFELEIKLHRIDGLRDLTQYTNCTNAVMVASCTLPDDDVCDQTVPPTEDKFFASQSGVFEALRRNLPGSHWVPFDLSGKSCQHGCAPAIPETRWCLNTEEKLTPYDDPASAGIYERAIKARVHPIFIEIQDSTLELCVNVATLAHRAAARLPAGADGIRFQWRLVVDAQDIGSHAARKPFQIQATTGIAPFTGSVGSLNLFPKQRMALAWMKAQELGTGFMLEEVADAEIPALGWRSEVRAECLIDVRGGICADHPGFGKTITSLALIESHYSHAGRASIEAEIAARQLGIATGLIPTAATLIVCPPHLLQQWVTEIEEKLGSSKNVLAIRIAKDLSKYTVEDFKQAKIIVANRKLFASDAYLERLAALAAVPAPFTVSGRSFQKWMQFASKQIPKHLSVFKTHGATGLTKEVKKRFQENIDSEVFQAAIPSRRLRGAAYLARDKNATKSISSNTATIDTSSVGKPLFEMFYFNRLIVDEFHESDPKEMAHIAHLQADKRWGLSGTPAMDDPYDVAQIARLLGVALRTGSVARGIMKKRNRDELRKDMTQFQLFDVMRETPSDVQQSRVHAHAQAFLDTFVRQNVMDFDIPFEEHLVPAVLDSTHRALYMELSQHLNSHDMQIKKVKMGKSGTQLERQKVLGEDLSLAPTAEGVLSCKAAYSDGTDLAEVVKRRRSEVKKILSELPALMRLAYAKEKIYFVKFIADVRGGSFGDAETTAQILELAPAQAKADSNVADNKGKKKGGDDSDDIGDSNSKRDHTAKLNTMCKQLVISKRSERYVSNLLSMNESMLDKRTQGSCDSTECDHQHDSDDRAVSAFCGHVICQSCFERSQQSLSVSCPAEGCSSELYNYHLLWKQKMGDPTTKPHGAKLASAMSLLKTIQDNDEQAIVFVQFSSQLAEVKAALKAEGLPAIIVHSENESEKIEDFKTSSSETAVAIVLNTADRTASGANLQNANHVIFLSPLLKNSQYEYSATMAQAIGRVRRHGQKRDVHVHRLVALDTIDVDILEHRERRTTALSERDQSSDERLQPQAERTQLIRDAQGHFSLQPRSWLINDSGDGQGTAAPNSKGRVPGYEDFSSLVKFSGAYAEGDD